MSKQITMKIQGMHCKGCALGLQGKLESLAQVDEAKVLYPEETASVTWNSDAPYEDALREAVKGAGFEAIDIHE